MIKRTIEQDGLNVDIIINLTPEEEEAIYREKDRRYLKEDIESLAERDDEVAKALQNNILDLDDEDVAEISSDFHDRLGDHDAYWEIHWDCLKEAILEYLKR